ncbi:MAG: glycerol-3-phosphate dehydrogenase [Oscillospiraceae bacterium]|nr:glycerol-3-phosphate dehydrogenase [Oscillospiraceae bacterium]
MKITVIGCGRWGSFIAWYADQLNHKVTLYGRAGSAHLEQLKATGTNGLVTLGKTISFSSELSEITTSDMIVISINSQNLKNLSLEIQKLGIKNKIFVLCMKGIDVESGKRLSEIISEEIDSSNKVAVWLGPGHVQEFCSGIRNCMVIDSSDTQTKSEVINAFSSKLIRFYYGQDLVGNEIGAASKNVIGIAAGMLDGLDYSTLKGALMSRGSQEISRLIEAMGGNKLSAYGLCHLGDYKATVFSEYSHNRKFGENFVKHLPYSELAEGYYTAKALNLLSGKYSVELPICEAVYNILYNGYDPKETLDSLFERKLKNEF